MKNLTTASLLAMTMATPVVADSERCFSEGEMVKIFGEMRQDNKQLSIVMAEIEAVKDAIGEDYARLKNLVIAIYEGMPIYDTKAEKNKAIMELRDKVELNCFKGLNK